MKILVIGAGSVGGYFGGRLALAGHEVYFVARGQHLRAIVENGLTVRSIQGDFTVIPQAREGFEPLHGLGLILVCVKCGDTAGILQMLKSHTGENTVVISLQNGVDAERALMESVPRERIVGGIAFIGSAVESPGTIVHTAAGKITIGELDNRRSHRVEELKNMFEGAKIPCAAAPDIVKAKWEKLLWNVGFNGICAITGLSAHRVLAHPPTRGIVRRLMGEHIDVACLLGIEINPALAEKYIENTAKGGDVVPSTLQDVRNGRHTEIDVMNGKIVEEGKMLGVSTPYNETVWAAVSAIDAATRK